MEHFQLHTIDTAPESAKNILSQAEKQSGYIANLYAILAEAPEVLKAYTQLAQIIASTSFTTIERNVIWLTINYTNNCQYCMAIHTLVAKRQGVPDNIINALRNNDFIEDTKLQALRRFTSLMVDKRGWVNDSERTAFYEAGYSKKQVLELIMMISQKTISNYVNHIANTPLDEASKPYEWNIDNL